MQQIEWQHWKCPSVTLFHAQFVTGAYLPAAAISKWPQPEKTTTEFGLQYGLKDNLFAPPVLSETLAKHLQQKGLQLKVRSTLLPTLAFGRIGPVLSSIALARYIGSCCTAGFLY
jgi:hypothetical protein